MRPTRAIAFIVLATVAGGQVEVRAGGAEYSTEPLAQSPIMSTAEVAVDFTRFNNWLVEKKHPSSEELPPIREHTYLLIDSILKIRQSEGRTAFNDFERFSLEQLFNLATGLGVYGAGLVARELASGSDRQPAEALLPKEPTQLRLQFPYFVLSSKAASWQVRFPYYFMLWHSSRFTAKNGFLTDMAVVSTSFSKHDKGPGRSQATIMFTYSPKADCEVFNRSWLELFAIGPGAKTSTALIPSSENFYGYDTQTNMHKEVTVLSDATGCYALAYSGVGGPYQANRVSYVDFVKSLDRTTETSDSGLQRPASAVTPPAEQAARQPADR
jgi:hypothetical protein